MYKLLAMFMACFLSGMVLAADTIPANPKPAATPPPLVIVDHVRFYPAPKREKMMVGGKITGSNVSAAEGFKTLAEITTEPAAGQWADLRFENKQPYRWVRYEAPPGSRGNVAELEFFSGEKKLGGAGFGSAGVQPPGGHWKTVFDGKLDTFFNSEIPDGQFAGLDLLDQASTSKVALLATDGKLTLKTRMPGTTIRYTLDGTTPSTTSGFLYTTPLTITGTMTVSAVAFTDTLAPSPVTSMTFLDDKTTVRLNTFSVGNSLTGNASRFPIFARTAGIESHFEKFLMGGAYTVKLWKAKEETNKEAFAAEYAKAVHPLAHFTMQPRDFDLNEEVAHELKFLNFVREKSPDVQPWLYAEWVEMARQRPSDKGESPSYQMSKLYPAATWEESMAAMLLYVEEVQHRVNEQDNAGKRARIIPCSIALGMARSLVDNNQFPDTPPGQASFYHTFFEDQVHVNPNGCYLVDLVWYGAWMGQSPEGKMLPIGTTLTADQAKILQQLAWQIVKNYPDCGVYVEGKTPLTAPEFSVPAGAIEKPTAIHLSSAPGAFFRYTLDGTVPTRTRGYVYCGVITAQPGMTIKALAYNTGCADSPVAEAAYPKK